MAAGERSSNAEVDFVINSGKTVIPVEVKAGKSGTLKSLHQFALQKKAGLAIRFDVNLPSVQRISTSVNVKNGSVPITFTLISLPLYVVEEVPRLVEEWFLVNLVRQRKESFCFAFQALCVSEISNGVDARLFR